MAHPLERFYPYLPVAMQNLGITLYGLAWRHERLGGEFKEHVRKFQRRESWTAERMQQHVERKLQQVLVRAFETVPYYRQAWRAAGVSRFDLECMTVAGLVKLPVTPKEHLRA